jgi:serine/threonine protein kinase
MEYCKHGSLFDCLHADATASKRALRHHVAFERAVRSNKAKPVEIMLGALHLPCWLMHHTTYSNAGIVHAMSHLHEKRVWHRDLKSQNVLLDNTWSVKVADFGEARIIDATDGLESRASLPGLCARQAPRFFTDVCGLQADAR